MHRPGSTKGMGDFVYYIDAGPFEKQGVGKRSPTTALSGRPPLVLQRAVAHR